LNSGRDNSCEVHDLIVLRLRQLMKFGLFVLRPRVDAIQCEEVKMNIAIQRVAETLDECNRAALRIPEPQQFCSASAQPAQDGSGEYIQDIAHQMRVIGHLVPQRKR
jgi:hypothetical protein